MSWMSSKDMNQSVDRRCSNINVPRKYQFNSLQTHVRLKTKMDSFKSGFYRVEVYNLNFLLFTPATSAQPAAGETSRIQP